MTRTDVAGGEVDHLPHAAQMIGDDLVGDVALVHQARDMRFLAVGEDADEVAVGIQFGDGFQLVLVQPRALQLAVDELRHAAIQAVDAVGDFPAIG